MLIESGLGRDCGLNRRRMNPTYRGEVWVFAEREGGEINQASYELLGKARELATQVNTKVGAVLVGQNSLKLSSSLYVFS